jgi:hypothetical protein
MHVEVLTPRGMISMRMFRIRSRNSLMARPDEIYGAQNNTANAMANRRYRAPFALAVPFLHRGRKWRVSELNPEPGRDGALRHERRVPAEQLVGGD